MKNIKTKLLLVLVFAVAGIGGFWYVNASQDQTVQTIPDQSTNQSSTAQITRSADGRTIGYDGQEGKTALEVLRMLTDVTVQESSFGEMVTGIDGVVAEAGKEYWAFYVNGAYASEGAGTYQTSTGEKIEWRLEEIQQ